MDNTAASDTDPVAVISFEAAFHSSSGIANFSRTSTWRDGWRDRLRGLGVLWMLIGDVPLLSFFFY